MSAATTLAVLRGSLSAHRGRLALAVGCIALGVALAGAVHTIHASALAEVDRAARALAGRADVEVRGPRNGFDESVFAALARRPEVEAASPVVELDVPLASGRGSLRVLGIDPFRAVRLQPGFVARSGGTGQGASHELLDPRNAWLTPAAVARLGARVGDTLRVRGPAEIELRVAGTLPALEAGGEVAVLDIAAVQELFGRVGRLTRIDLRLRAGADPRAFRESVAALLPPGVAASEPASISGRAAALTRAYRVNLNALASMALLTGLFLVFSTLALQAARRREELALLRALGLTRGDVASLLALEGALLGAIGAAAGTLLGLVASRAVLERFGSDLGAGYFRGMEGTFAPDPAALAIIALLGVGTAAGGAWIVARGAGRMDVAEALKGRAIDLPGAGRSGTIPALALAVAGGALAFAPPLAGLPVGGYLAIAAWLGASVLVVGPACRTVLARVTPANDAIAALAVAQVRHLPGHLAASVAGIVVSASLCSAMAVMVHSFRLSLDQWLTGVVGADLYARAATEGDAAYFTPAQQERIARVPGIARADMLRYDRLVLAADAPPVTLIARPLDEGVLRGFQAEPLARPADATSIPVWVSEAAVDLNGWRTGQRIELPVAGRRMPVVVAGTFRDYARTWGAVLMDLGDYRRASGDDRANDAALHLADRSQAARVAQALRVELADAPALAIEDAATIHRESLAIFDRTFAATYALEAVAILIALAGVTSSFAAMAWSRRREFGVLRYLGLTRRDVLRLLAWEGAAAGALGAAIGLASGASISLVLVHVVNRQSFHWGMEVHWPFAGLAALAAGIVLACALGARWSGRAAVRDEAVLAVKDDS